MSRLEHVLHVGAAIQHPAPTPTAVPPPAGVYPRALLADDVIGMILGQVVEGTPVEDLCSTVRARCLLLYGSGNCPPDETIWRSACERMGLTPQAGFAPLGTWQGTFGAFCTQLGELNAREFHDAIRLCMRGHADLVPYMDRLWFLYAEKREPLSHPERDAMEVKNRQARWRGVAPLPIQLLEHHGVLDRYPEGLQSAVHSGSQELIVQLLGGRPSRGLRAVVSSIDLGGSEGLEAVGRLLHAGVNPNSRVEKHQTLLQYAVTRRNPQSLFVVSPLVAFGADQNVQNDKGKTPVEVVTSDLFRILRQSEEWILRGQVTLQSDYTLHALMYAWRALDPGASNDFYMMTPREQVDVAMQSQ